MKLVSSAFEDTTPIPPEYTCDGNNINPPLSIQTAPPGTKSFTLIMSDPDAPGEIWIHWTMWNIPPDTSEIAAGISPKNASIPGTSNIARHAVEGTTSFNTKGYGGPCPPSGTHRYIFRLYALDIPLTSRVFQIEEAMRGHVLGDASLMGTYSK